MPFFRDKAELLLLVLLLASLPLVTPRIAESDAVEYFSYLPSLLLDGDLDFEDEYRAFYEEDPDGRAGFKETFLDLYDAFDAAGVKVLRAIARFLKVDEEYFTDTVRDGNSVMRLLHYPAQTEPTGNHIRAGAHEDINTITLLLGAEEAGLELKTRDGRWIPVSPKPGELVINIGDMLQRLTNGVLRSTSHRVVNPPPERASHARYSMPFFLHFRPDFVIEALPGTVPPGEEPKWPPISSHEYLQERLREIKLK